MIKNRYLLVISCDIFVTFGDYCLVQA